MLKNFLVDGFSRQALHTARAFFKFTKATGDEITLITTDFARAHGTFSSANRTSAGTTIVVQPDPERSIAITDILISTDKQPTTSLTINFTDDTDTIQIFKGVGTDNAINLALGVSGRIQGWRDARIDMITTGNLIATVTIGYIKLPEGLDFKQWDALR